MIVSFANVTIHTRDACAWLHEHGIVGPDGEVRPGVDRVVRLINLQLKLARALGLVPAALGKLGAEIPDDLARALAGEK